MEQNKMVEKKEKWIKFIENSTMKRKWAGMSCGLTGIHCVRRDFFFIPAREPMEEWKNRRDHVAAAATFNFVLSSDTSFFSLALLLMPNYLIILKSARVNLVLDERPRRTKSRNWFYSYAAPPLPPSLHTSLEH